MPPRSGTVVRVVLTTFPFFFSERRLIRALVEEESEDSSSEVFLLFKESADAMSFWRLQTFLRIHVRRVDGPQYRSFPSFVPASFQVVFLSVGNGSFSFL